VAPSTLRSWDRRYGLGPADHEPGRYRRYSERDVGVLQLMCRLVGQGVAPAAAAAAARAEGGLDAERAPVADEAHGSVGERRTRARLVRGVVDAAQRLDGDAVSDAVGRHLAEHGVVATWQQLCRPALTALDRRVAETGGSIDAQLVANWAISTALRSVSPPDGAGSGPPAGGEVLLACVEGEQHTLATEALHAALTEARLPARTLGPSVPESALVAACRRTRPEVAVLWSQTLTTARPLVLQAVAAAAGSVLALGPGWSGLDLAELPESVDTADDLPAALHHILRRCDPRAMLS
jgi:MerR family transcriptional regulator, light-induced transcriptional regulator